MTDPVDVSAKTLLIVDDEEIIRNYLKLILKDSGYRVIVAENGEDGVMKFKEHPEVSLIIADVCMPGKNGKEFLDEIFAIRDEIKVIMMSGDTAHLTEWIMAGKLEFINKPFTPTAIIEKIHEVLRYP